MAMRKRPVMAISGVLILVLASAAAWFWLDRSMSSPLHQARECRAAAQMARSIIQSVEKTSHAKWQGNAGFNPLLSDSVSSEAKQEALRHVPVRLKSTFFNAAPLDCTSDFKRSDIPIVIWPHVRATPSKGDWRNLKPQFTFSRITFSFDGKYAYTDMDAVSGPLSGTGHETRWVRKDGAWVLDKMNNTWIS
jgi:hypothetical protein